MASGFGPKPETDLDQCASQAAEVAHHLAMADTQSKNTALCCFARLLDKNRQRLIQANKQDLDRARDSGLDPKLVARLGFDNAGIDARLEALKDIIDLPDPVGQPVSGSQTPIGLSVQRVRSPLGVVLMVYEARPHVTVNAAALCLKSGNASILRGGSEVATTNGVLGELWQQATIESGLPGSSVQVIQCGHDGVSKLLTMNDRIDLVIPRGGKGLIRAVSEQSTIPVLKHEDGICHVYIDSPCDLDTAVAITLDSKCLMPQVCNAAETLLVHADHADDLSLLVDALDDKGVEVRGCERTQSACPTVKPATDEDWDTEYLGMKLSVRVVDDVGQAIKHILKHGSRHTDTIVTDSVTAGRRFTRELDSAVTLVNASTMFDDGKSLGLGAEIGIATGKIHARGPMGLESLTIPRLVISGQGQVMGERFGLRRPTEATA